MAAIFCDFLCFPEPSCLVDALHGREVAANDALYCLHHPLESFVISSRAAAVPGSNAAREDALRGEPVEVCESFCRHAKLLECPQEVYALLGSFYRRVRLLGPGEVIVEHTEELEAGHSPLQLHHCELGHDRIQLQREMLRMSLAGTIVLNAEMSVCL